MRMVIQRVKEAHVTVENDICGKIGPGILVLLAISREDTLQDTTWMVNKLTNLRMFTDANDKMNLSVQDIKGEILIISQFTLYADCTTGRRPSFTNPALPEQAIPIYEKFVNEVRETIGHVQTGQFGAKMEVGLINDGPVTFIIDNKKQHSKNH